MLDKYERSKDGDNTPPFVNPKGYRAYVEQKEEAFREILAKQQAKQAPEISGLPQNLGPSGLFMDRDENCGFLGPHQQTQMPTFLCAGHRSPELGERPTAGSDEGSISTIFPGKYQGQLPLAIRGSSRPSGLPTESLPPRSNHLSTEIDSPNALMAQDYPRKTKMDQNLWVGNKGNCNADHHELPLGLWPRSGSSRPAATL